MTSFTLDDFLPYQLAVLVSRVSRDFARHYGEAFDITIPEWRVVAHLSQSERVSVREIHLRVDMDKSKVSRAASKLEASGYISKRINPVDRRLVELELTEKGRAMMEAIQPIAHRFEDGVLAGLPKAEAEAFRKTLAKLLAK